MKNIPDDFILSLIVLSGCIVWCLLFLGIPCAISSSAKGYIDDQYRKYHKIPELFTKEKIYVKIKSETKKIYNDTELRWWTSESWIENDDNSTDCNPVDADEWFSDPVFPSEMWIDLDEPVTISLFVQIHNDNQEVYEHKKYYVKLDYDDFKSGKTYSIKSTLLDKNAHKAEFVTKYSFELELPMDVIIDYLNPFKGIEFVTINSQ